MRSKTDQRLPASLQSARAPGRRLRSKITRKKHSNSARSKIVIHTRIRPHSIAASPKETRPVKSTNTFPSITDIHSRSITDRTEKSKVFPLNVIPHTLRYGSKGELHDLVERTKKRRKQKRFGCLCSLPCLLGLLLIGLLLGILLAILIIRFLPTPITASLTSTSMTTTLPDICNSSCVNQSWISTNSLLAAWEFDNNLIEDVSNTLTVAGQSPSYVTGYVSKALLFGANANQSVTSSTITLTGSSFTIETWIYPTGFPNLIDHSIVGLCPLASNYECLYLTVRKSGSNYIPYFGLYGDDCPGNGYITLNEWAHVAFVFETNSYTQSIYINGVLDVTRTAAGPFKANSGAATIGNIPVVDSFSGPNYFQGMIDRVEITGRDKLSCEILEEATLSAYFNFNSASFLADSGPNSLPTVAQSVSLTFTGHSFQAISFTGSTSSYFQVSDVTSLGIVNRPFSISIWVRPQLLTGRLVHVSSTSAGFGWCVPFLGFAVNGSLVAQMYNSNIRSVLGPAIPLAPAWTHIVETWAPMNGLRLYVNNVLVASTTSMATSYTASSLPMYVTLGNSLNGTVPCATGLAGSTAPFTGDMDEFRIYSRELSADDVCALYTI